MKKNTIIYVVVGVVALIIIALSIYLAVSNNSKSNNRYATKNIKIEKYNESGEVEKVVEIKKRKDETSKYLGIKTDVKIDLQNGVELYLQNEIKDYCFYKTDDVNCTIKMPEGLLDYVNKKLKD